MTTENNITPDNIQEGLHVFPASTKGVVKEDTSDKTEAEDEDQRKALGKEARCEAQRGDTQGEILVSETRKKEAIDKSPKEKWRHILRSHEAQQWIKKMHQTLHTRCECTMCRSRSHRLKPRSKIFDEWGESARRIRELVNTQGWPKTIQNHKILTGFVIGVNPQKTVRRLQLRTVELHNCKIGLAGDETSGEVVLQGQGALRFMCGLISTINPHCDLEGKIQVQLVAEARHLKEVKKKTPLDTTYINTTCEESIPSIQQIVQGKAPETWLAAIEKVQETTEALFGPQLMDGRLTRPALTQLDSLLCPITNQMSTQMQEELMEMVQQQSGNDQSLNTHTCYAMESKENGTCKTFIGTRQVVKLRERESIGSKENENIEPLVLKVLLWNIENTAMAFDLQNAIAKRSATKRRVGPPRENVWEPWMLIAKRSNAHVLVYTEASLPLLDVGKRKKGESAKMTKEIVQMHKEAGYNLFISYAQDGTARYGQMIAVRIGIKIISVTHGFGPGEENKDTEGRVTHVEIAMEGCKYRDKQVNSFTITGWYMHNSNEQEREKQQQQYCKYATRFQGPAIIATDSNCVANLEDDVGLHQLSNKQNRVEITDTLDMKTGMVIPDKGLATMQMFRVERWNSFEKFMASNRLRDARTNAIEKGEGIRNHTCHWPWAHWTTYVARTFPGKQPASLPPMFTAEIDRVLVPDDIVVKKVEVLNETLENTRHRNEIAQTFQSLFSDHFVVITEVVLPAPMIWDNEHPFNDYENMAYTTVQTTNDTTRARTEVSVADEWISGLRTACAEEDVQFKAHPQGEACEEAQAEREKHAKTKKGVEAQTWARIARRSAEMQITLQKLKEAYSQTGTIETVGALLLDLSDTNEEENGRGFVNSIESKTADEVISELIAIGMEYAIMQQDNKRGDGPRHGGLSEATEMPSYIRKSEVRVQLQYVEALSKKIKRSIMGRSSLRAIGIIHTIASSHSLRGGDMKEYLHFRKWQDAHSSTNDLVSLIVKCQRHRRKKLVTHAQDQALEQTNREAQEVAIAETDQLFLGNIPAKQIEGGRWMCIPSYLMDDANENACEAKHGKLENAEKEILWVECMEDIIRQTEAESTTRIQGHVSLARKPDECPMGETRKKKGVRSPYIFAGSMLIDSGCSFTIVGYSFFEEYCRAQGTRIEDEMIAYPEYYEAPCASVAKKGCAVYGVGFARLRIKLLTTTEGLRLRWDGQLSRKDNQTEIIELEMWAHVFRNINTSILLGMPFVYRHVQKMVFSTDVGDQRQETEGKDHGVIVLKTHAGKRRAIPMIAPEGRSTHPIMLCLKHDTTLVGLTKATAEVYPVGQTKFAQTARFAKRVHEKCEGWCFDNSAPHNQKHPLRYSIEPIQHYSTLFEGSFVTEGVCTELTARQMEDPKIRIQAIPEHEQVQAQQNQTNRNGEVSIAEQANETIIPAGTAVALVSQKCYGVETWMYEAHGLDPEEIRKTTTGEYEEVYVVVPTPEVQSECEGHTKQWNKYILKVESAYMREMLEYETRLKNMQETKDRQNIEAEFQERGEELRNTVRAAVATLTELVASEGSQHAKQLANMVTQMMWMTREKSVLEEHKTPTEEMIQEAQDTGIPANEILRIVENARKTANKEITKALRTEMQGRGYWRKWMCDNNEEPAVAMLMADLGMSVDRDFTNEKAADCCRLEPQRAHQDCMKEASQKVEANKEMDNLVRMLRTDTAAESDQFGQIMEQPVSVTPFFQKGEQEIEEEGLVIPEKYYENVPATEVLQRMSSKWRKEIEKTAPSLEAASRLAAYMCQVDVGERTHQEQVLLFKKLLKQTCSKFFNIDPTNPPRFKGTPFDWVRLRKGESKIAHQERRIPPAALPAVLKQIQEWLRTGVVEKSQSPHSSPLLLVKKKPLAAPLLPDGSKDTSYIPKIRWRTCVDYVQLNRKSEETDISNAPRVEELLEYIGNAGLGEPETDGEGNPQEYWVSTVDLYSGFNQWMLSEEVKPLTAFTVPGLASEEGRLQFRVLPFGLASAPTRFNTLVAECLGDIRFGSTGNNRKTCTNYIDDVYIAGVCTYEQHLDDLEECFSRLQAEGFAARMDKAELVRHEISMLGWTIGKGTKSIQKDKLEKIDRIVERCENVKDVMTALGTIGFYRQLIPMCGDIEAPLYDLTRKGAWHDNAWTPIHTACMRLLKHSLKKELLLALPRIGPEFPPMKLATDASNYAGGACLSQEQPDGVERPICYASKTFTKEQRNWSASERELWTLMYFATDHFKHYLQGEFVLFTDHKPLTHLFKERGTINPKLARWAARLSRIRAKVEYRCGTVMGPADLFSRLLKDRPTKEEMHQQTPDIRTPITMPRGALQEFENVDTETKGVSLNRVAGVPQQRVAFLKQGMGIEHPHEKDTARQLHTENGPKELTPEMHRWLDENEPLVADRLLKIQNEAEKHTGKKAAFAITRVRDVLKAELGIKTEEERIQMRKDMEIAVGSRVEKDDDYLEDMEEVEIAFPEKLVAWTTVKSKDMGDIFKDATGEDVEYEEEEIICNIEATPKDAAAEIQELTSQSTTSEGEKSWRMVKEAVLHITQDRINKIHGDGTQMSKTQRAWINSLTDPRKTVVVCQGGAGSGKTYTAMLVACVAVKMGLITKVRHSKPLVSAGGAGLGFERGAMADKLKYWCAPAREAMERIEMHEVHRAKVESFPIDRVRGVSIPGGEWMIFDEMQNASKTLFKAAMTRAEEGGKVILCGDVQQEDCSSNKNKNGMKAFLEKWESIDKGTPELKEEAQLKHQLKATVEVVKLDGPMMREAGLDKLNKFMECMVMEQGTEILSPKKCLEETVQRAMRHATKLHHNRNLKEIQRMEQAEKLQKEYTTAPVFASFAGMDMLGMGMRETFPEMRCVGASERNGVARKVFRRQHGFQPFLTHEEVPNYAYSGVFMVTSGAPCVAFSCAGKQSGSTDPRGRHYVDQATQYVRAQVPVVVLEQVPQAKRIFYKDIVSRGAKESPQQRVVRILEEGGYHVPLGPEGDPGNVVNASEHGGVMDRERLITIAIRNDLWKKQGHLFEWPKAQVENNKKIEDIFIEPVQHKYIATEEIKEGFMQKLKDTKGGTQILATKGNSLGDWFSPDILISGKGKAASVTAMGNTRWIQSTDVDGKEVWRRLNPSEVAKAMGIPEKRLELFSGVSEEQMYNMLGNGVPLEIGRVIGSVARQMWDPTWFKNEMQKRANKIDVYAIRGKQAVSTRNEPNQQKPEVNETQRCGAMAGKHCTYCNSKNPNKNGCCRKCRKMRSKTAQEATVSRKDTVQQRRKCSHCNLQPTKGARTCKLCVFGYSKVPMFHVGPSGQGSRKSHKNAIKRALREASRSQSLLEYRRRVQSTLRRDSAYVDTAEPIPELEDTLQCASGQAGTQELIDSPSCEINELSPMTPQMAKERREEFRQAQMQDPVLSPIMRYLEKGDFRGQSISKWEEVTIVKAAEDYVLWKGNELSTDLLYRIDRVGDNNLKKVCVPKAYQQQLMNLVHNGKCTTHMSAEQMYRTLHMRYYWTGMCAACAYHVKVCDTCQRTTYAPSRKKGGRQYIPVSSPFACCAIDVVGPIGNSASRTSNGNRFIVTIVDWFTRWVEAYPVKDASQESIVEALEQFTSKHGVPRRLVSDNASNFHGKAISQYQKALGLKRTYISSYRPEGNSRLERFHRTLGQKMKQACHDHGSKDWDTYLRNIVFAYNCTPHSATGYSPAQLVYGRQPMLPFDIMMDPPDEDASTCHEEYLQRAHDRLKVWHAVARERMSDVQVESIDKLRKENKRVIEFKAGEQVMLFIPAIPKGASKKIAVRWHGPYRVAGKGPGRQWQIEMPTKGEPRVRMVHESRLKSYHEHNIEHDTMNDPEESEQLFRMMDAPNNTTEVSSVTYSSVLSHAPGREKGFEWTNHAAKKRTMDKWYIIPSCRIQNIVVDTSELEPQVEDRESETSQFGENVHKEAIDLLMRAIFQTGQVMVPRCCVCLKPQPQSHYCKICFDNKMANESLDGEKDSTFPVFKLQNTEHGTTQSCNYPGCKSRGNVPGIYCTCERFEEEFMKKHPGLSPACEDTDMHTALEKSSVKIPVFCDAGYPAIVAPQVIVPSMYNTCSDTIENFGGGGEKDDEKEKDDENKKEPKGTAPETKDYSILRVVRYDSRREQYKVVWDDEVADDEENWVDISELWGARELITMFWAGKKGCEQWKRLRTRGSDSYEQTIRSLQTQRAMRLQRARIAGIQLTQARGSRREEVWDRIQKGNMLQDDQFIVILTFEARKLKKEEEEATIFTMEQWSWTRIRRVLSSDQTATLHSQLRKRAKARQHTAWLGKNGTKDGPVTIEETKEAQENPIHFTVSDGRTSINRMERYQADRRPKCRQCKKPSRTRQCRDCQQAKETTKEYVRNMTQRHAKLQELIRSMEESGLGECEEWHEDEEPQRHKGIAKLRDEVHKYKVFIEYCNQNSNRYPKKNEIIKAYKLTRSKEEHNFRKSEEGANSEDHKQSNCPRLRGLIAKSNRRVSHQGNTPLELRASAARASEDAPECQKDTPPELCALTTDMSDLQEALSASETDASEHKETNASETSASEDALEPDALEPQRSTVPELCASVAHVPDTQENTSGSGTSDLKAREGLKDQADREEQMCELELYDPNPTSSAGHLFVPASSRSSTDRSPLDITLQRQLQARETASERDRFHTLHFSKHTRPSEGPEDNDETLYVPLAWGHTFHYDETCPQLDDGSGTATAEEVGDRHMLPCPICAYWTNEEKTARANQIVMRPLNNDECFHTRVLCPALKNGHTYITIQGARRRRKSKCRKCAQQEQCPTWRLPEPSSPTVTILHPGGAGSLPIATLRRWCIRNNIEASGDSATLTARLMEQQEDEEQATRQVQLQRRANEQQRVKELQTLAVDLENQAPTCHTANQQRQEQIWDEWDARREETQNTESQSQEESSKNEVKRGLQIMGEEDRTPKESTSVRPKEHRGSHHPKSDL